MAVRDLVRLYSDAEFTRLMEETHARVFSLAMRLSGDRQDAEDLTQEAYYRAYRAFPKFQGDRPFVNWVMRILTRLYLDLNRQQRRGPAVVSYDTPIRAGETDNFKFECPDLCTPESSLMDETLGEEIQYVLASLSDTQKAFVWMADVEGASYKELAVMFDMPIGTVRSRLHRLHKQMRSMVLRFRAEHAQSFAT